MKKEKTNEKTEVTKKEKLVQRLKEADQQRTQMFANYHALGGIITEIQEQLKELEIEEKDD